MSAQLLTFPNKSFKYLTWMSALYITILMVTMIIENHLVMIGSLKVLSGTLVLPLAYMLSDVITEVYGYREMRKLIWVSMFALYVAAFIFQVILSLPVDSTAMQNNAYLTVLSPFMHDIVTYSIAATISLFLNAFLLSKWKILVSGRYFWLRSLGASMIGEAIFIIIWGFLGFSDKFALPVLLGLMFTSYIYKIIYNLFAIVPASLLVVFLQKSEGVSIYDEEVNFNPFVLQS